LIGGPITASAERAALVIPGSDRLIGRIRRLITARITAQAVIPSLIEASSGRSIDGDGVSRGAPKGVRRTATVGDRR
jgi:hypothetical protein